MMRDDIDSILLTEEQIQNRVREMGAQITADYAGKEPLFVGVLKGCFMFVADLIRCVDLPCSMDFMVVSSYGAGVNTSGAVKIIKDLDESIEGLDVLVVEDIIDSGRTLSHLLELLEARNPKSLKLCTLLDKPDRRRVEFTPDYVGAIIPDEFVIGYGLDYNEKYRELPYVGVLKPAIYK